MRSKKHKQRKDVDIKRKTKTTRRRRRKRRREFNKAQRNCKTETRYKSRPYRKVEYQNPVILAQ